MIWTRICDLFGIKYPIVQAPMGPFVTTKLCAAVSNAGGLGVISHSGVGKILKEKAPQLYEVAKATGMLPDIDVEGLETHIRDPISELRKVLELTDKPIGINVRVAREEVDAPYLIDMIIEELETNDKARRQLKVIFTSAGDPRRFTKKLKDAGLIVFHVVPSVYHAKKALDAGVDGLVASGHEAGGHVAYDPVHTSVLVPAIVKLTKGEVPVLSAGGWCDGRGLAAALAMGADGIYMGTRFIATKESDFSEGYKMAILRASERDTVVIPGVFGPVRVLKNTFAKQVLKMLEEGRRETDPEFIRFKNDPKKWEASYVGGDPEAGPILAGEVSGNIDDLPTVKELIERIVREAEEIIKSLPQKYIR
ncbi:MAG: NAD(P)H-dependent flavin oxidoreductase [Candidatus Baldrarchaeia archaeon]